jgi:1,2-phenylacetyl-CoA epoxidase catalytic subunit
MFFLGEDSVADNLSPYIDAAPREEQKYFLATQQVDEVRHSVFFHRFFSEVIGAGDSIASTLAYTESQLGWGYRNVFERLDRMADDLRRDRSLPNFARAIALYHMVVEATLAQPGQHYIEDYFVKAGTMPGFSEGMASVSRDEQRHIGFGVKALAECFAESEECKHAVAELLREVMPYSLAVFAPPNWDLEYTRCYGFELEDIFAFGLRSVRTKWRAAGYPLEDMPGVLPLDPELPEHETAVGQIRLLRAGVLGEPNGRPDSDPEVQRLYFDLIARTARTEVLGGDPMTIQWRFADAEPWFLRIDNGSTAAEPGLSSAPDLTLETSWKDWIAVSTGGESARRALLRRRIRPHGSPRNLLRLGRLFPPRPARLA